MSNETTSYGNYTIQFGEGAAEADDTAGLISETTTAGFTNDVVRESRNQPVLVDFWAPWCGPCKQLQPALEKVVREAAGRVRLVKMNIDDHPAIASQLGIQSIPAVVAFKDGQPVDGFMGAVPESQIREFIERLGGKNQADTALDDALEAAKAARDEGDPSGAARLYAAVLQQQPENVAAIAGLADTLVDAGDIANAREVLARAPEDKAEAPELAAVVAKIALAEQVAELGDEAELFRRLAADQNDHEARFDLALIQNAKGERIEAADNLLAIMKADREWREDGARQQLLTFFEAWGPTDPATATARRRLSSLLFS